MTALREAIAPLICGYFAELPDVATYIQRKSSTREWYSKQEVLEAADQIRAAVFGAIREPTANMLNNVLMVGPDGERLSDKDKADIWRALLWEAEHGSK